MNRDRPSRQQRRREFAGLIAEGRSAIARGLPNPVPEHLLVGVGLVLQEALAEDASGGAAKAAGLAIRLASGMIDAAATKDKPACRLGCDHCCHFAVSASAPEIFHLAREISRDPARRAAIAAALAERGRHTDGMDLASLMSAALPCPLLDDGACGAYGGRPIVCRQFMSRSVEACAASLAGDRVEIPVLKAAINAGVLARNLLLAAVRARGLDNAGCHELSSALHLALSVPNAERRWLAGEDVLAPALAVPRAADAEVMVERVAAAMRSVQAWSE